jgi:hypothetical protein
MGTNNNQTKLAADKNGGRGGSDGSGCSGSGGGGNGSGDSNGDGDGNDNGDLPSVNDETIVTTTFLTKPTASMRCRASARGRPPTTDLIQRRINANDVGR